MDPSIMKLLEEDEDDTMHSGADVEAFTAALNRDIEGGSSSSIQPFDSASYPMWDRPNHEQNINDRNLHDMKNLDHQMQISSEMNIKQFASGMESGQQVPNAQNTQKDLLLQRKQPHVKAQEIKVEQEQHSFQLPQSSAMAVFGKESNQMHDQGIMPNPTSEAQTSNIQNFGSHPTSAPEQASNAANRARQIPFGSLLPIIIPELDKDRAMQLTTLYNKLKRNEIAKEAFVRLMKGIVGDHMLKMAVVKMQSKMAREAHPGPNQVPGPNQAHLHPQNQMQRHHLRPPANNNVVSHSTDPYGFAHHQSAPVDPSRGQAVDNSSHTLQDLSKHQQQHLQFPPASMPIYGSGSYHPYGGSNVNTSSTMAKPQPHDSLQRHPQISQSFAPTSIGGTTQQMGAINASNFDGQNTFNDVKRFPTGSMAHVHSGSSVLQGLHRQPASEENKTGALPSLPYVKQEPTDQGNEQPPKLPFTSSQGQASAGPQFEQESSSHGNTEDNMVERHPSTIASTLATNVVTKTVAPSTITAPSNSDLQVASPSPAVASGSNSKATTKKASVGQKKPLDTVGSSPPLPSKKQKVAGTFADQSIDQLNDVTAVSGVNLREEEEQLFSVPKDDTRASEVSRKVVQEEEEKLLLEKLPLQKKLAEIMTRCGLKNVSSDVERCLSLCVEERLRGLLSSMIRISRQRVDAEKLRHRTVVNSDIRQQILAINQKAKEEWDKKQAEADKLRKMNEPETGDGAEGDKDENRGKSIKVNKEDDDKMRTTAANVAARAAVGGDDMLSKWQLMAEQARQKREGGGANGAASSETSRKPLSTGSKSQGMVKRDQLASTGYGALRGGRNQATIAQPGVARNISVKDVISVLEREPQTAKSAALYRLYEKVPTTQSPSTE